MVSFDLCEGPVKVSYKAKVDERRSQGSVVGGRPEWTLEGKRVVFRGLGTETQRRPVCGTSGRKLGDDLCVGPGDGNSDTTCERHHWLRGWCRSGLMCRRHTRVTQPETNKSVNLMCDIFLVSTIITVGRVVFSEIYNILTVRVPLLIFTGF